MFIQGLSWPTLLILLATSLQSFGKETYLPSYPLRNGDFSSYQGYGRPAKWLLATEAGRHTLSVSPVPRLPVSRVESVAVVRSQSAGQGYVWQTVSLLPGTWKLAVEVAGTSGVKAQLEVSRSASKQSKAISVSPKWQQLALLIPVASGDTGVHLRFFSPQGGVVRFRRARLDAVKLQSQTVPTPTGPFGAIILPRQSSAAERFAGYELQRYVFRMTGRLLGISGRDAVFPGKSIRIGRAARREQKNQLKGQPDDAYVVHQSGSTTTLTGNTGLSTLYAVYDYLQSHGCRWVMPGALGEVVPRRQQLRDVPSKLESPDFHLVRAFQTGMQQFFPGGGWIYIDIDEYRDWVVRNRLNSIWGGGGTVDLGADRGFGWSQHSGHSWNALIAPHQKYFARHPEWYPLVKGKRMPRSDVSIKLPNQLCVSNQSLRDYTVRLALDYFRDNPRSRVFPMNPMDGPNYNCECAKCRSLDPPGYEWNQDFSQFPRFPRLKLPPLADRYLNYVNEVTRRVAEKHPDKLIEFYNYASRVPPTRERVHPNVAIKFTYLSGREVNVSLMDARDALAKKERNWLRGWAKSGTKYFTYYPYTDWQHPDASIHWYFNCRDLLFHLHKQYGCVGMMGETHTTIQADPIWWAIYARTLWNVETDYRHLIRGVCKDFYGPAGQHMAQFYLEMDKAILQRDAARPASYHPNNRTEFSIEELARGAQLLELAAAKVSKDSVHLRRVDLARFSFALLTMVRTQREQNATARGLLRKAETSATRIRGKYAILVRQATQRFLKK